MEVGYRDRVLPGAIVDALANEGGIRGFDIGKIDTLQSFSLVTIYADLNPEQLSVVGRATFAGRELRIRSDEDPGHDQSSPNGAERHSRRHDQEDRKNRGDRNDRGERSEHGFHPRHEDGERGWKDRDRRGDRGGYDHSERGERRDNRRWDERRSDRDGSRGRRENWGGRGYDRNGHQDERHGYGERNQNRFGGHRGGFCGGCDER